jgi:hypothetical protein
LSHGNKSVTSARPLHARSGNKKADGADRGVDDPSTILLHMGKDNWHIGRICWSRFRRERRGGEGPSTSGSTRGRDREALIGLFLFHIRRSREKRRRREKSASVRRRPMVNRLNGRERGERGKGRVAANVLETDTKHECDGFFVPKTVQDFHFRF